LIAARGGVAGSGRCCGVAGAGAAVAFGAAGLSLISRLGTGVVIAAGGIVSDIVIIQISRVNYACSSVSQRAIGAALTVVNCAAAILAQCCGSIGPGKRRSETHSEQE